MSEKSGDFLKGLLVGGVAGIILGILYAPKSGKETRAELGRRTEDLLSRAKEDYEKTVEVSKKTYEAAVARLRNLESVAKAKFEHVEEDVGEFVEDGKEILQDGKSRFKRALDAGIEAFREEKST